MQMIVHVSGKNASHVASDSNVSGSVLWIVFVIDFIAVTLSSGKPLTSELRARSTSEYIRLKNRLQQVSNKLAAESFSLIATPYLSRRKSSTFVGLMAECYRHTLSASVFQVAIERD